MPVTDPAIDTSAKSKSQHQYLWEQWEIVFRAASTSISFWIGVAFAAAGVFVWITPSISTWTYGSQRYFIGYGALLYTAFVAFVCTSMTFPLGKRALLVTGLLLGGLGITVMLIPFVNRLANICCPLAATSLIGWACSYMPRFRVSAFLTLLTLTFFSVSLLYLQSENRPQRASSESRHWPPLDPSKMPDLSKGSLAPNIEAGDLHGQEMSLSEYRGKVVMLVFWASWCQPCIADVPHEKTIAERFSGRPFEMLGVNVDETKEHAIAAVKQHSIPWRSFWNGGAGGPITDQWGIRQYPTIYLIDDMGVIQYKDLRGEDLDTPLEQMISTTELRENQSK